MVPPMSISEPQPPEGIPGPRRRSGTDQTTERLVDAAAKEFMERGYEAFRVSSIARRAGLTSGAVYARWPTKSDVAVAALDHIFEQILPARRLKDSGVDSMGPLDMISILGANLLVNDETRDVMVHVFSGARNNEDIGECLREYLHQRAQEVCDIFTDAQEAGLVDPELSVAALSLLGQAAGIGIHLLLSAGLEARYVPTEDEWNTLMLRLFKAAAPPDATAS
ncbi:MAG: TetR/AcrR family transcriptional regulator [Acidimicrobiaceae bacterium]|nr:TetR/AcrR family transcriptional regulator [Acidimicrobiaceae bacterium]MYL03726.1 TetR/AcrR family transcriptional regulator [Acidimicrobiaceae bacterium]